MAHDPVVAEATKIRDSLEPRFVLPEQEARAAEALEGYRATQAGSVRVLGLDPRADHTALVPRIGVMLQKGGIYPTMTAGQVLDLFAAYYPDPEEPAALLEAVGLTGVRRTPWRRLSGGEQPRLSLALALVGRPEVLFLDEPTAGVDPEGRLVVRDLIAAQRDQLQAELAVMREVAARAHSFVSRHAYATHPLIAELDALRAGKDGAR